MKKTLPVIFLLLSIIVPSQSFADCSFTPFCEIEETDRQYDFYAPNVEVLQNFYVTAIGGMNFRRNEILEATHDPGPGLGIATVPGTFTENIRFNTGWHAGGAIGYLFEGGFRVEAEISHRHQEIRSIQTFDDSGLAPPAAAGREVPNGHTADLAIMVNGFGTVEFSDYVSLNFGVGLGTAFNSLEISPYMALFNAGAGPLFPVPVGDVRERNTEIAWQAIGGMTYDTRSNIVFSFNYKFFGTGIRDPFYRDLALVNPGPVSGPGVDRTLVTSRKTPYNHTIDASITWIF